MEARGKVRERYTFAIRIGDSGRTGEFRLGRTGFAVLLGILALFFALTTEFIYDYRDNLSKLRELHNLRERVSEQNLTLYNLHAKFESIETEVERIRMLDTRVRSLVNINESLRTGGGNDRSAPGIGGSETPESAASARLDRLLDLRCEQLKESILVDVKNMETVCEKLDANRIVLESVPAVWPTRGILGSGFGVRQSPFTDTKVFHHGVDIDVPAGTPVKSAAGGKVVRSGYEPLFGNIVVIDHGYGYQTLYAHLSERLFEAGAMVRKGDIVGKVGGTGRTTGPHLHYEVHVNGLAVNPARFLN